MEVSVRLEIDQVPDLLARIGSLIESGFAEADARLVGKMVAGLRLDEEKSVAFDVAHAGKTMQLTVFAYADDPEEVDLTFETGDELAAALGEELEAFLDERRV